MGWLNTLPPFPPFPPPAPPPREIPRECLGEGAAAPRASLEERTAWRGGRAPPCFEVAAGPAAPPAAPPCGAAPPPATWEPVPPVPSGDAVRSEGGAGGGRWTGSEAAWGWGSGPELPPPFPPPPVLWEEDLFWAEMGSDILSC